MNPPLCTEQHCKQQKIQLQEVEDPWGKQFWACPSCGYKYDIRYRIHKRFKPNEPGYIG